MAKILHNPTEQTVKISINGKDYSVDPMSEILVENDVHADYWKSTHAFLGVRTVGSVEVPEAPQVVKEVEKVEEVVEVVEEVKEIEEEIEEEVEEPKKATKSKK